MADILSIRIDCFFEFIESCGAKFIHLDGITNSSYVYHYYKGLETTVQIRVESFCMPCGAASTFLDQLGYFHYELEMLQLASTNRCECEW